MLDPARLAQAVGAELSAGRTRRFWTRARLRDELTGMSDRAGGAVVSLQALATYESGSRGMPLLRFCQLAYAVGVPPSEMLARALARARPQLGWRPGWVRVDLTALSRSQDPRVQPLVAWAALRVRLTAPAAPPPVDVPYDVLAPLVAGSGHDPDTVMRGLLDLRPAQPPREV
ncbi:hypothetical protein [Saccharothrix sp.]|uniref:hypothetical protein n=1 Tax=Saccharothrix sp. TaxID=1873460 RepID=UPI0028125B50|nr:hypothetical protein [Saccharothrix sp.]